VVRPNTEQRAFLQGLRGEVLEGMQNLSFLDTVDLSSVEEVPLGVLRSNATQRHGVTRWKVEPTGHLTVEVVDLHPALLNDEWRDYALFVMYHEFLHVLGHRAHDGPFRSMEAQWPDQVGASRGKSFTHERRLMRAKWHWFCSTCDLRFPRQRRGGGRYMCRTCRTVLQDVPTQDIQ
jgi:predicted SprT family Zn-dependent metalloprotease